VWAVRPGAGFGEPVVGDDVVYFLGEDHSVRAIAKSAGAVRWTSTLPIPRDLYPGYGSLLLPGQLIVADQDVFSLDPSTGAIQWRFQAPVGRRPGYDAPVVLGETLFMGSGTGHVFAIDRRTGALRWVQTVADTSDGVFRPALSGSVLYVGVSRFPPNLGQIGSRVVALETSTGAVRWTRDLPLLAPRPGTGTHDVLVVGDLVIAASGDGIIHALDAATGVTRWTAPRAQPPVGSALTAPADLDSRGLTTDGTRIYASSSTGAIVALSPTDGAQLWASGSVHQGALFNLRTDGRFVYAVYFFGPFSVFDAATGAERWSYTGVDSVAKLQERFTGTCAFDATNVYLNGKGGFYAFRKE
jgi:outer membrane protein assembly factor BamB